MVAGPHAKTQANMLGRVKVQNECIKKKTEQKTLVTWVLNNPEKCGTMSDLINNGQLDMYINGQLLDPKAQKPLLRKCHMWERVANEDQKRVLFNDKHMPSETAKKLARTTIDKSKLWVFLTARKKKGPINSNMTHQELWNLMDNRSPWLWRKNTLYGKSVAPGTQAGGLRTDASLCSTDTSLNAKPMP